VGVVAPHLLTEAGRGRNDCSLHGSFQRQRWRLFASPLKSHCCPAGNLGLTVSLIQRICTGGLIEDKFARQLLNGFADVRLNPAHLAWIAQTGANGPIADKRFLYYYMSLRGESQELPYVRQVGGSVTIVLSDLLGESPGSGGW